MRPKARYGHSRFTRQRGETGMLFLPGSLAEGVVGPQQAATEGGYQEIVERLLAAGVTVNAIASGYVGRAALREAAEDSFLDMVDMLLEAGVDVNSTASGYMEETAISAAIKNGHSAVAERLRQASYRK